MLLAPVVSSTLPPYPLPTSKRVIRQIDDVTTSSKIDRFDWPRWSAAMEPFWMPNLVHDSVFGIGNYTGLKAWLEGGHTCWNRAFDNRHPFRQQICEGAVFGLYCFQEDQAHSLCCPLPS
jgi:hypothetical protein